MLFKQKSEVLKRSKKSKFLSCVSQKRCSVNILDRKERFLDHKSEIEILDRKSEIFLEGCK